MSVSAVSPAMPQYQVPVTPKAKSDDERTESAAVRARESETGNDSAVAVKTNAVDITA